MIITIDGPAGAGKSTVARRLADELGFELLDTGAMYRALTLTARRAGVSPADDAPLGDLLLHTRLQLDSGRVLVNGDDVSDEIRTPEVTAAIQGFADHPRVRAEITRQTRALAEGRHVVTEGRDQGTEVFPHADLKFFVTARDEVRATRRHAELVAKGIRLSVEEVLESQRRRDEQDAARPIGKLVCPDEAVVIDASDCTEEDVLRAMLSEVGKRFPAFPSRDHVKALAHKHLSAGDPFGWFEELYASAGRNTSKIPWADRRPNEHLMEWLSEHRISGDGKRAVVVGCGIGDDAHRLAGIGFQVTAFDLSPSAIDWARERFGNTNPRFEVVDLFAFPASYRRAFDFVFEAYTWQALPKEIRPRAIEQVGELVKPTGELLMVSRGRDTGEEGAGPPWPLTREELETLTREGLRLENFEDFFDREGVRRFRALYRRPNH